MATWDDCLMHYHRLLQLLAEDKDHISRCFQGEILEIYRTILEREQSIITSARNNIIYNN